MLATHQRSQSQSTSISSPRALSPPLSLSSARPTYKTRRPSLTNTMSKFKDSLKDRIQENVPHVHRRAQSNSSRGTDGPYEQRTVYISEPQLNSSADSLPSTRLAPLGSGAIVVGTPQEALALSAQRGGYRGPLAATSMPSRINHVPKQHPAPVAEEELEYADGETSPPLPPLPTSGPNSPTVQSRGLQQQQRDWTTQPKPRRSGESNTSSSQAGNGSRGLSPVLPDRRSQGSAKGRGSPLARPNKQLHPEEETQARSVLLNHNRPKSDPEQLAVGGGEMTASARAQPERKSGTDADMSRSKMPFSSYSDPGCRNEVESGCFAAAPQLPVDLATALPQPTFEPVLMSNLPANMHKLDPSKVIVILETGEATIKSTLKTLTSRPSYLATYLNELVASTTKDPSAQTPLDENGDSASTYNGFDDSEADENYAGFDSLFQDHLKSTGILKPRKPKRKADATSLIRVFLDRPSAPYAHIIAYLRAPILQSHPEGMLPYAARLFPAARHSFATARLEALLDLRDEAAYLGLTDLTRLCDEELAGQVPLATDVGRSSVHSSHTLCNSSIDGGATKGKDSVDNSPPVHSVDIPIVLPTHESRDTQPVKTSSTNSNASSKRERHEVRVDNAVQVPSQKVNKIPNASQLRARGLERTKPTGNYF